VLIFSLEKCGTPSQKLPLPYIMTCQKFCSIISGRNFRKHIFSYRSREGILFFIMPPLVSPLNFWQVFTLDKALSQGHYQNWACTRLSITSCALILVMPFTKGFKVYPTCKALCKFASVNGRLINSGNAGPPVRI
jgi:hypothetical protein